MTDKPNRKRTRVILLRHCEDAKAPRKEGGESRRCASRWLCEHACEESPVFKGNRIRDPCLTQHGVQLAKRAAQAFEDPPGVSASLASPQTFRASPTFPECAVWACSTPTDRERRFRPELVITSPLRRALQTACLVFEELSVPIVAHPAVAEINVAGKRSSHGIARSALHQALQQVPRGREVDLSLLSEEWSCEREEESAARSRLDTFLTWLGNRPEKTVCIVAHGAVIRYLAGMEKSPQHGTMLECVLVKSCLIRLTDVPANLLSSDASEFSMDSGDFDNEEEEEANRYSSFAFVETYQGEREEALGVLSRPPSNSRLSSPTHSSGNLEEFSDTAKTTSPTPESGTPAEATPDLLSHALALYSGRVAGRHLMFNTPDGRLFKEADRAEIDFYTAISEKFSDFPLFVAEYHGVWQITGERLLRGLTGPTSPLHHYGVKEGETYDFVALKDVTFGLKKPCVMDIKMGRTQYYTNAPQEKIKSKEKKSNASTSRNLYFRVCGMKTYRVGSGQIDTKTKKDAYCLQKQQMQQCFVSFFSDGEQLRTDVIGALLLRLEALQDVFMRQKEWRFITSSLLLVYEGDPTSPAFADVRMIDFAHTEAGVRDLDCEYLYGLVNLIDVLRSVQEGYIYEPPVTPLQPFAASDLDFFRPGPSSGD